MRSLTVSFDRTVALVPVRGLEAAKARLGEALDAEERSSLVDKMLRLTIAAARNAPGLVGVIVVSSDPAILRIAAQEGAATAEQHDGGLNEGLEIARTQAIEDGANAVIVIPADLPAVTPAELSHVLESARNALARPAAAGARPGVLALVTDRAGSGTNLLVMAPPDAIPFQFGPGSRARHAALAGAARITYIEVGGPLALDVDTPDDLLMAEAVGLGAIRAEVP